MDKPLGGKAYGSIPHLVGSRRGVGDRGISDGQSAYCFELRPDHRVFVTEKLDGACVAVANVDGQIVALGRAGYRARHSHYEHIRMFADWVAENEVRFASILMPGERVIGEWLALAHGTLYCCVGCEFSPFVAFDVIRGDERVPYDEFVSRLRGTGIRVAGLISAEPLSIAEAMVRLGPVGFHGAQDRPEGVVWRVEKRGRFSFMAKYVRPDFVPGCYFPQISGGLPVWNWRPRVVSCAAA